MTKYDDAVNQSREIFFEKINGKRVFVVTDLVADSKQLVLMSHGFRGTSCGPARQFVDFATHLKKNGISAVRFDQPHSGNSEGDYLHSSFNEWVETTTYLARKYLDDGYQVTLMGQSMGASTSVIASAQPQLQKQIRALLLWVPDPKSTTAVNLEQIYEESGQKYYGRFWQEAKDSDFFDCLEKFKGEIHLVYGEHDRYIKPELRQQVIDLAKQKKAQVNILSGEDHSPWKYQNAQEIMKKHLHLLKSL
jgi:pimeloyl-ACP methyl ester carboxylesterase